MTQQEFFKRFTYSVSTDRIGGGGFGTVYKAKDHVLHRTVAIKVSEVKTTADGQKTFSLKDEFEALNHVPKHPNIANYEEFYSFEMPNGVFDYAVMQYYPDGNLSNAIKQGLTAKQKEDIATQLLEGIAFLHEHKVVHRDLKPGNVLIVRDGENIIPLITDFGLSKAANMDDGSVFSNSFGGGTQRYSSPEQLQGKPLRLNTDLWSYGAILYELFTGEQLFSAGSGAANTAQADLEIYNKIIHGDVSNLGKMPEKWRSVAERCLVIDPELRAKSAAELLLMLKADTDETEIDGFSTGSGTAATKGSSSSKRTEPTPKDKPNEKKGFWIGLGIAAVVALLLILLWPNSDPVPPEPTLAELDSIAFHDCQTVADYRSYVAKYGQDARYYSEAQDFIDRFVADSIQHVTSGSANGHEWVDLGLPSGTLWSICNVGASQPEEYGNYFAWGESKTKTTYEEMTYKYYKGADSWAITKYCSRSDYGNNGFTDTLTILQAEDDPSNAWGDGWHTPTKAQWDELLQNTTKLWTTQKEVNGMLFTADNGQTIFLPAAGQRWSRVLYDVGSKGFYWSSSLSIDHPCNAWQLSFSSDECDMNYYYSRYSGFFIRPVREK